MNLFIALRKEWQESLRTYRLLIVAVVLAAFGLTSPLIAKLGPQILSTALPQGAEMAQLIKPATLTDAVIQYVKNMGQFEVILAVLLGMGAVAQEKDKGTAALMLVKPLPRGSFLGAKFLGQAVVFAISILIAGIGCYYYTMLLFESMNVLHWLFLNVFLLIYAMVIVAITLLCSTIMKSQAAAGGMAIGILVIGWIAGAIRGFGKYLPGEINSWGVRMVLGDSTASWIALGTGLGVIIISLLAAWLVFRRQEL